MNSSHDASGTQPTFSPMAGLDVHSVLADVILTDPRKGRPLGRPWVTVAVCRDTKMVAGFHVSLDIPGAAAVGRCLAHAFRAKDVGGLGLANDWPCEGVAETVTLDLVPKYESPSLRKAAAELGLTILFEPNRRPGAAAFLESFFEGLGVAMLEGKAALTFSPPGRPGAVTRMPPDEFAAALTRWIVDEHQFAPVAGSGLTRRQAWNLGMETTVLPKPSADALSLLEARRVSRKMAKAGFKLLRRVYWHDDLVKLRNTYGPEQSYVIRVNPEDPQTFVLEVPDGTSLTLRSDRPDAGPDIRSRIRTAHATPAEADAR